MAGYGKSYSSYRGRSPKWKGILSAVLVLVIAVSVGYLALERYIVYDETGTPHVQLPGGEKGEAETPQKPHADLVVEETPAEEVRQQLRLYFAPEVIVTQEEAAAVVASSRGYDGAVITLKAMTGRVGFYTPTAISTSAKDGTAEAIASVLAETEHTAAHLICFIITKNRAIRRMQAEDALRT